MESQNFKLIKIGGGEYAILNKKFTLPKRLGRYNEMINKKYSEWLQEKNVEKKQIIYEKIEKLQTIRKNFLFNNHVQMEIEHYVKEDKPSINNLLKKGGI